MPSRIVLCLALLLVGCSTEEPTGCQKDTDCKEGRICENHACTNASSGGSGGGSGGSGGSATACSNPGESCAVNGDCCGFNAGDSYCVSGTCAAACTDSTDKTTCVSTCCAPLAVSGFACAPVALCNGSCFQAGEPCSVNSDCCNFLAGDGYCVGGYCADECSPDSIQNGVSSECVSGCCAPLEGTSDYACAPEYICQ